MVVGHFSVIEPDECWALLRQRQVGRIGWVYQDQPQILPVTYLVVDHGLTFRTAAASSLAAITGSVVFEIDDIDEETQTGWSVVARGQISTVDGPTQVEPWAPGVRDQMRLITVDHVSGRAVSQGSEGDVDVYA